MEEDSGAGGHPRERQVPGSQMGLAGTEVKWEETNKQQTPSNQPSICSASRRHQHPVGWGGVAPQQGDGGFAAADCRLAGAGGRVPLRGASEPRGSLCGPGGEERPAACPRDGLWCKNRAPDLDV